MMCVGNDCQLKKHMWSTPACSGVGCGMADHRANLTLAAITHHTAPLTPSHQGRLPAPATLYRSYIHTGPAHTCIGAEKP